MSFDRLWMRDDRSVLCDDDRLGAVVDDGYVMVVDVAFRQFGENSIAARSIFPLGNQTTEALRCPEVLDEQVLLVWTMNVCANDFVGGSRVSCVYFDCDGDRLSIVYHGCSDREHIPFEPLALYNGHL